MSLIFKAVKYWLSVGAKPTKPTERLLGNIGLLKAKKVESSHQKVAKKDRNTEDSED